MGDYKYNWIEVDGIKFLLIKNNAIHYYVNIKVKLRDQKSFNIVYIVNVALGRY